MSGPWHPVKPFVSLRQQRLAVRPQYHRNNVGGTAVLKAVTRTRRAAASHQIGTAPGKAPGPANWRIHRRRALASLATVVTNLEDRAA